MCDVISCKLNFIINERTNGADMEEVKSAISDTFSLNS